MRGAVSLLAVLVAIPLFAADAPDFERDVAPILVKHCLECHQPNKKSGELNLATATGLLAGGEQGKSVIAGKPDESLLIERITAGEMPPKDAKETRPLSDSQINTLRNWITAGATWPKDRELGVHGHRLRLGNRPSAGSGDSYGLRIISLCTRAACPARGS